MNTDPDLRRQNRSIKISFWTSLVILFLGMMVIIGWITHINRAFVVSLTCVFVLLLLIFFSIRNNISTRTKAEEKFKALLEAAPDAMIISNEKGEITLINQETEKLFGYARKELIGKPVEILIPQDHQKNQAAGLELFANRKNGTKFPVEIRRSPLQTEERLLISTSIRDMTESKRAEQKFRSLLEAAPDAMIITNEKGYIVLVNRQTEAVFGYTRGELINKPVEILIPAGFRRTHVDHRTQYFKDPKIRSMGAGIELFAVKKNGTQFPVEISLSPLQTEEGILVSASVRDITQRKELAEKLKNIEEQYRLMIDEVEEYAIILLDKEGIIKNWNRGAERIKGYKSEEIIGKNFRLFYTREDLVSGIPEKLIETATQNGKATHEGWRVRKDGTTFWGSVFIAALHNERKAVIGFTKVTRDITEIKKVEEQITYMARLLEDSGDAIFSTDTSFIIKTWNKVSEKLYGYTPKEAIGQPVGDIIRPQISLELRQSRREELKREGHWMGEVVHLKKDGTPLIALVTNSVTRNPKGEIDGYISVCRDITKRKELEEQLKKANLELEAFTYSVSHDLRAPLRGIIGFTTILEEDYNDKLDEEGKRVTAIIKNNALKMGRLIDDLLAFSRMGRQDIQKTDIDTSRMVEEVIKELSTKKKDHVIEWDIASLPAVKGDINTIRQVWINLISNAIKYSGNKEDQRIQIGTRWQEGHIIFFIKDNGVGFDEQYKDKLFKVFQRLHGANEFEGTGVGLALVERIVSKHGGKVWAEAELNKGATFYFSLPEQ